MKIRKATDIEKQRWTEAKELYPLFGYVVVEGSLGGTKGRWSCAIEYLGEGKDEPNYEAHAPKGMHFNNGDILHTVLGTTQQDLLDRLGELEECNEECGN
jgi:hypothetical protein